MWLDNGLCKLCLVYSRTKDLISLGKDDKIPDLLIWLAKIISNSKSRSNAFTSAFNVIRGLTNNTDPYADIKIRLNELGKKLAETAERYLEEKNWDIKEALRISAAANIVDTSVLGYEIKNLDEAIWDKPIVEEFIEMPRDRNIYLVLDNAGEAAIDLLLAKALKINGYRVYIVVRKESYEIDVLKNDLWIDYINIIETPGNLPPIYHIDNGFIIAKGIANAEAYIEIGKIPSIHLLRAKCEVIAKLFAVPKNSVLIVSGTTLKKIFKANTF